MTARTPMTAWMATDWVRLPCHCRIRLTGHPDGPVLFVRRGPTGSCHALHTDHYPIDVWETLYADQQESAPAKSAAVAARREIQRSVVADSGHGDVRQVRPQVAGGPALHGLSGSGGEPQKEGPRMSEKDAACSEYDPELWFSDDTLDQREARRICASCPIKVQCAEVALAREGGVGRDYRHGVWGGLDRDERFLIAAGKRPPRPRVVVKCGTDSGYYRHTRNREEPCADCRAAHAAANRRRIEARQTAGPGAA